MQTNQIEFRSSPTCDPSSALFPPGCQICISVRSPCGFLFLHLVRKGPGRAGARN